MFRHTKLNKKDPNPKPATINPDTKPLLLGKYNNAQTRLLIFNKFNIIINKKK